ncbi:MAG: ACT domain-containing protein [Rhodospirillales bacterium]
MTTAGKQPSSAREALLRRTSLVERLAVESYERFLRPLMPEGIALLAVGGFGRRELFPHSDVDLLLVVERQSLAEGQRPAISRFLQELWDGGLRVSHSVRTPSECCEVQDGNVELSISLLDHRYLAGDRVLFDRLSAAFARFVHAQRQAIAGGLCHLARERHLKAGGSIYQLEPNVKDGPGGLRDYQVVCWFGQLRNCSPDRLPPPEVPAGLEAARDFLTELRFHLHQRIGRDSNLLTFDLQEEAAAHAGVDPSVWMREYYGHARAIHRAAARELDLAEERASTLLVQFKQWRSRVSNAEFSVSRERVYFREPHRLEHEPELALRLFQFVARHGLRLAPETDLRIANYLPALRRCFSERRIYLWGEFRQILEGQHRALALRLMHQTRVLDALLPGWEEIDCLVVRDFYHRYTVDEHTLVAVQILEDLYSPPQDPLKQRFAGLLAEVDDPATLWLALLLHDLGKAKPEGPHVAESVRLAEAAMERLGVPENQRRDVRLLIDRHLDFSIAMASRDLDEPGTARMLAGRAGTLELAKKLALLTFADIGAVNPTALSPWRTEQLWCAYLAVYNELTRELEEDRLPGAPDRAEFLEGFPVRYLRTHSESEIAADLQLDRRSRERGVALDIRKENGFYRLRLVARDRPSLLASLAGALSGFGMNILKMEGFANRHGAILDTFVFSDPHRTLELNPSEADRLRILLERVALGKAGVKPPSRSRPFSGQRPRVHPAVSFDGAASQTATLIEVVAEDRPGLLYDLASTISSAGANIELALIDTQGNKAVDVFYVTADGRKLNGAEQATLAAMLRAILN